MTDKEPWWAPIIAALAIIAVVGLLIYGVTVLDDERVEKVRVCESKCGIARIKYINDICHCVTADGFKRVE